MCQAVGKLCNPGKREGRVCAAGPRAVSVYDRHKPSTRHGDKPGKGTLALVNVRPYKVLICSKTLEFELSSRRTSPGNSLPYTLP